MLVCNQEVGIKSTSPFPLNNYNFKNMHSLQPVIVGIDIEFLQEPVQQELPVCLAVFGGRLLEAVRGVMAAYPQHVSHGVPDLGRPVEIQRLVF